MPLASGLEGKLSITRPGAHVARTFIWRCYGVFALAVLVSCLSRDAVATPQVEERKLTLHNIHTQEDISIVYKRGGAFVPEALGKLDNFMRDWRRNVTIKMDPELYDVIWTLQKELDTQKPIQLICGHRSAVTNERLRHHRGGQARGSLHITGQAADIQFPDIPLKQLRNSALIMERGGVGYYPSSGMPFVHVDTGRVRHWPRIQRQELAVLFPSGYSKHVPSDGRPLTPGDFRIALASLQEKGEELPFALQRHLQQQKSNTLLASLKQDNNSATPGMKTKTPIVFASLTPSFSSSRPQTTPAKPVANNTTRPDASIFTQDSEATNASGEDDDIEYDEEEMADDLAYQPYPLVPFLTDLPVASVDMTGPSEMSLAKVHLFFGETRDMLNEQFRPGVRIAEVNRARYFRGAVVNTALRSLDRDAPQQATKTQPLKMAQGKTQRAQ
jgi:uncharacterized protein YcbK (DUF882 family)